MGVKAVAPASGAILFCHRKVACCSAYFNTRERPRSWRSVRVCRGEHPARPCCLNCGDASRNGCRWNVTETSGITFTIHDLRRTFASIVNSLDKTLSYYTIKRLLNHNISGDVTANYIQHDVEQLRAGMQAVAVYRSLRGQIESKLARRKTGAGEGEYMPFVLEDYVDNPVALARIKADITQAELARRMGVSQAYVSKIEAQARIGGKVLAKVQGALRVTRTDKTRRTA